MLPLLFAGMTAAAQNQDMARLGTYMDNGEFVVGTAETVLAADITVRCEKIVCGPYARYAQKFLGLRAPLTDKTVYTVADAAIALMPGERYGFDPVRSLRFSPRVFRRAAPAPFGEAPFVDRQRLGLQAAEYVSALDGAPR